MDDNVDAADSLSMLLAFQGRATQVAYGAKEERAAGFDPELPAAATRRSR